MKWYYPTTGKQTAAASYVLYSIGFLARNLVLKNDSGDSDILFSWNGTNDHGHVGPGEPLNLGDLEFSEIYIKTDGAATFRIWAYSK